MPLPRYFRRTATVLALGALLPPLVVACGGAGDDDTKPTPRAAGGALSRVCPAEIVVQTSWLPTTTGDGPLYGLLGADMDVDPGKKRVSAPLVAAGRDTGVLLQLRAGGPAIGFTPVSAHMYADQNIHLGGLGGFDETIQMSAGQPTLAVLALVEKDPQAIIWDPQTYPDFDSIRDIGKTDTTVVAVPGKPYLDYLTGAGILHKDQIDDSGDGSPSRFVAEGGKVAVSGYAAETPYTYEKGVQQWGKPVRYQMVYDTGYPNYGSPLVIRAGDRAKLAPCLKKLVPIVQQAQLDFLADPGPVIARTVKIGEAYRGGNVFTEEIGEYGVTQMKKLGIASNDPEGQDATVGNFDTARVQRLIDITSPIIKAQKKPVAKGLKPGDVVTNDFIDPTIGYP